MLKDDLSEDQIKNFKGGIHKVLLSIEQDSIKYEYYFIMKITDIVQEKGIIKTIIDLF